jgi:hypothetical protein
MKKIYLFILILFLLSSSKAGFDPTARGGKAAGMAFGSVASTDFWSVFNNQAASAWNAKYSVGAFFENKFSLKEMSTRGIGITIPVSTKDVFGLNFTQYGYSAYNESKLGFSYAKSFADKVAAGLQFDYLRTASNLDGLSSGVFTFEFGLQSKINRKLMIGFYAFNPIHSQLSNYNDYTEYIPVVLKFGLNYHFSDKFSILAETEKDLQHDAILRFGGEYLLNERFYVTGGMSTGVIQYSIGFGAKWNGFTFDIASSYHLVLGVTPTVSLYYTFPKLLRKKSTASI